MPLNRLRLAFATVAFMCLSTSIPALAQDGRNVLIVVNTASAPAEQIASRYATVRKVPLENIVRLKTGIADDIERLPYQREIEGPIAQWLSRNTAQDRILYILLIKGIPLRIRGTDGPSGTVASVDSELTLLYRKLLGVPIPVAGPIRNPYFLGEALVTSAKPFSHADLDIYLVGRLDAYTIEDVNRLIDRGASPARDGEFVLDQRAAVLSERLGDAWLADAARELSVNGFKDRVVLESSRDVATGRKRVLGYYSWGSNDRAIRRRRFDMEFAPGALAGMFVSTDGRTFSEPPADWTIGEWSDAKTYYAGSPQSLIGDLIREGVTGVAGHVAEPFLEATVRPQILFPAYVRGFNLIESFYLGMPSLSWQTIVIGDPLCAPFRTQPLSDTEASPPLDSETGLPVYFSNRLVSRISANGTSKDAAVLAVKGDGLLARGDREGARKAFERATEIDSSLTIAHLALAGLYERGGEYDKALERYRAILAYAPNEFLSLNNLAYALAVRKNSPAEALPLAERAYKLTSGSPQVADTLGWIHHLLGRNADAERILTQAVKGAPRNADIRLHLAQVYHAMGRQDEARAELTTALEIDPRLADGAEIQALRQSLSMPAGPAPKPKP